jgi:glycosyltransferase involved in cell wall biosynthesis
MGHGREDHMNDTVDAGACVPAVSVGLPVFNGETFLEVAIASVLGQTFDDLELIICDNASTDRTAEICRDYAARDSRVRYFRNPHNLGAAPNYNLAFSHARGRYFKWLAHDDRITPSYLAKTVRVLDERSDAVLCNSVVSYIDQNGAPIGLYNTGLALADSQSAAARFAWMVLQSHSCVDFFGLIRRATLQSSLLHGSFHGADRALLAQLAIRGRLIQLPAPLVEMREHPNRYTRSSVRSADRAAWHDASKRGKVSFPTWRLYAEYLKMVRNERMLPNERAACYAALARWWAVNWNIARAGVDVLAVVAPGIPGAAERLKVRLFGAAPGHLIADRKQ